MKTGIIDAFLVYQFVRRLATPFNKWAAFREGVIDANGNVLIPPKQRTLKQANTLKLYDVMVMNLKKTLAKIPGGGSRLATFAAALYLLKEDEVRDEQYVISEITRLMETVELNEAAPVNNVGGGAIAGMTPEDTPKRSKSSIVRRKINDDQYVRELRERIRFHLNKYLKETENH